MPKPRSPIAVIHIPHWSTEIPDNCRAALKLSDEDLDRELLELTDRYTDELFALTGPDVITVRFLFSRLVVDPERFLDDAQEPMVKWGMGVIYTKTSDDRILRVTPTDAERRHLIEAYYAPHHRALSIAVRSCLGAHDRALIIDAHSFPNHQLPWTADMRGEFPDVCIGTDEYHTPSWLTDLAVSAYRAQDWDVMTDRPFSGALVPQEFYRQDQRVSSVMVELNRRLYMDEATGARLPGFDDVVRRNLAVLAQTIEAFRTHAA